MKSDYESITKKEELYIKEGVDWMGYRILKLKYEQVGLTNWKEKS